MKLSKEYLDAIENQDTLELQIMLVMIIYSDEGFNTNQFIETFQAVKKIYPQIIVPHVGTINSDKLQWDEDYYNQSLAELRGNFSQERINHVMEVGRYLHGQEEKNMNTVSATNNVNRATEMQQNYKKEQPQIRNERRSSVKSVQSSGVTRKKTLSKIALTSAVVIGVSAAVTKSIPLMLSAVVVGGAGIYTLSTAKK